MGRASGPRAIFVVDDAAVHPHPRPLSHLRGFKGRQNIRPVPGPKEPGYAYEARCAG